MTNDAARKREAAGRGLAWRSEWLRLVSRRLGTRANVLACAAELMMRAHNGDMSVSVSSARIGADTGKIPGKIRSARGNLASAGFLVRTGEKRGPREHQRDVWWLTLPGVRLDDADAVHAERLASWWAERLGDEGVPEPVKAPTTAPAPGAWRPVPLSWAPPITLGGMAHLKLRRYRFGADGATVSERRCHRNGSTVLPIRSAGATETVAQTDCRTDESEPTRGTDESLPTSVDRRARERDSAPAVRPGYVAPLGPRAEGDGDPAGAAAAGLGASAATVDDAASATHDDGRAVTQPQPQDGSAARIGLRAEHDAFYAAGGHTTWVPADDLDAEDDEDDKDEGGTPVPRLLDDHQTELEADLARAAGQLRAELEGCCDPDDEIEYCDLLSIVRGAELLGDFEAHDLVAEAVDQGWLRRAGTSFLLNLDAAA